MDRGGTFVAGKVDDDNGRRQVGLSFLFAPGTRPDADAIARLSAAAGDVVSFAISHRPAEHPYWLELLALGLTFDLLGLAPGIAADTVSPEYAFGVPLADVHQLESLTIRPGPHLAAGGSLLPVVRAMTALGCEFAGLPGVVAVGWEPARSVMAPDYYRRSIGSWLKGGVFPGLGLTALSRAADGVIFSVGLSFFIGQEMRFEPLAGESPADAARLALRVIHDLVANGPYPSGQIKLSGGDTVLCEYLDNRRILRISRPSEIRS